MQTHRMPILETLPTTHPIPSDSTRISNEYEQKSSALKGSMAWKPFELISAREGISQLGGVSFGR
jgi:hypothetical protein